MPASAVGQLYDEMGRGYRKFRRADARIASHIERALGAARSIVNVGAGSGSYEPLVESIVAVEPSLTMIAQRPDGAAPVARGLATALPFRDATFDASLAVLTIHHWPDRSAGLAELARVARRRVVVLTCDPEGLHGFWLIDDYLPEIPAIDRGIMPTLAEIGDALGGRISVEAVPVPHDCTDGFLGAYWRRPEAYLDPGVRRAISAFARLADAGPALERLRADLDSGEWQRRHGDVLAQSELDLGYRLVVCELP